MSSSAQDGRQRRTSASGGTRPGSGGTRSGGGKTPTGGGKGRPGGASPGGRRGGPGRPVTASAMRPGRNWATIGVISAVLLIALGIVGYGGWTAYKGSRSWQDRAAAIEGLLDYRRTDPKMLAYEKHTAGPLVYRINPAVGGTHNNDWQNCMGDVYDAPIAQEHAVHSLEHGAVWITYRPDLPKDQVDKLTTRVVGKEKMMMSPYQDLDSPISLQAWGYRLKVPDANDPRIDEFIKTLRVNASVEGDSASCSQGITATGDTPRDLPPPQQQ